MRPRTAKLVRGRSKASRLVVAWSRVHVFVWMPSMAVGPETSTGMTVRARVGDGWTHWRLTLFQRNGVRQNGPLRELEPGERIYVRPTLTLLEVSRWRTEPDVRRRVGAKAYLRVKLCAGGRRA